MSSLLERVRRPEYTGENRCWPCTLTNGVLLAIVTGVLLLRGRRRTAAAVAVGGLSAIGLRGYLVPYTPSFAPRLVSKLPVDVFDHDSPDAPAGTLSDATGTQPQDDGEDDTELDGEDTPSEPDGEEVLAELTEAGAVQPNEDGEIELTPEFRSEWREEMAALRDLDLDELAAAASELTPSTVDVRPTGRDVTPGVVLEPRDGPPTHMRRAVAVPELAAASVLEGRVDESVALTAGRPLRSLLEQCPLCGEELLLTQAQCCGETIPLGQTPSEKLLCTSCNERLFTYT